MKCTSCSTEINSKMKAAIKLNTCPFCGSHIMEPKKAKQYASLQSILDKTKFTNKDEVDSKIRDKVLEVLTEHFDFTRLSSSLKQEDEDLVALDDEVSLSSAPTKQPDQDISDEEMEIDSNEQLPPPRNLTKAKAEAPARQPLTKSSSSIYHQAQRDMYEDVSDDSSESEDVEDPELRKYFQDTTPAEIREKVEARLQAARNVTTSGGIRRLR